MSHITTGDTIVITCGLVGGGVAANVSKSAGTAMGRNSATVAMRYAL